MWMMVPVWQSGRLPSSRIDISGASPSQLLETLQVPARRALYARDRTVLVPPIAFDAVTAMVV